MRKNFVYNHSFTLECGEALPALEIAYDTWGTLSPDGDNVVWVCHGLTASSDASDWWPHTVEAGRFLNPERYFIVCVNMLGSCYGTTGPLSLNPATGQPWYGDFPCISIRDQVHLFQIVARHLGIRKVHKLVGSSIGGFVAMEWLATEPDFFSEAVLIATAAKVSPWISAFNESQRMAIEADQTWGEPSPDAAKNGLSAARSIALLSYRGRAAYNLTQHDESEEVFRRRVNSYQRHQGEKLVRRFNAYSYYRLSQTLDSHDVGRGRGGIKAALARVQIPVLVISVSSDLLFPPVEMKEWAQHMPQCRYVEITSDFGHDGFLVETEKINDLILDFSF